MDPKENRLRYLKVKGVVHIYIDRIRGYVDLGSFLPIKYLNVGSLLMLYSLEDAFVYMDPKQNRLRYLKVKGAALNVEPIAYTPGFISLKHVLSGENMMVLNARSRC